MTQKLISIFAVFVLMAGMFLVSAEAPIENGLTQNENSINTESNNPITIEGIVIEKVIINDVEFNGDKINLNSGEEVKVEVYFLSNVNSNGVTMTTGLMWNNYGVGVGSVPFDIEAEKHYKKTIDLKIPIIFAEETEGKLRIAIRGGNLPETKTEFNVLIKSSYIKGDLNKNGELNIDDLNMLIDHLYESLNPLPEAIDYQIADMDNDHNLDISDITLLIQKLIDLGRYSDKEAPVIKLVSPSDNSDFTTSKSYKTINFRYQVTDESNIASCKLILDGNVEETDSSVERNITNSFSIDADRGNHDWKISCTDAKGNEGFSQTRDFDIDKESSSTNTNTNNVITTLSNKATTTPTKDINTRTNSTKHNNCKASFSNRIQLDVCSFRDFSCNDNCSFNNDNGCWREIK